MGLRISFALSLRLELVAKSVVIATLEAALLALPFARFDQVLEAA